MKRMQLFEFEDLAWFPDFIRRGLTRYLATLHRVFGTPEMLAPLLSRVLQRANDAYFGPLFRTWRGHARNCPNSSGATRTIHSSHAYGPVSQLRSGFNDQ